MSVALNIYHRLPPFSRSAVASLRGYYLNWWRYDDRTDRLVEAVLERDTWSEKQWSDWQSERLSFVLERAATRVPYYRRIWSDRRSKGDRASWSYIENWNVLEKEILRAIRSSLSLMIAGRRKCFTITPAEPRERPSIFG